MSQTTPSALGSVQSLLSCMAAASPSGKDVGFAGADSIYLRHEDGQHVLLPTALAQQLTQYTPAGILPSTASLMKKARKRAPNWSNEEQACLVSIWSAPDMQEKFKKATRKWPLWEEMGKMLERAGFYGRDAKQCEALMHRLKSTYYRCVNHNRQPGNEPQYCAFYSEIDAVLSQKDACKTYVESDEESRVSDGELHGLTEHSLNNTANSTGPNTDHGPEQQNSHTIKGVNGTAALNHENLKHFVEQLAETQALQSQIMKPGAGGGGGGGGAVTTMSGAGYPTSLLPISSMEGKLGTVDYCSSLMKLLKPEVLTMSPPKTSPKMADSTTMSPPMSVPRVVVPHNKRPRSSSPAATLATSLSTEEYLQSILTQSQLPTLGLATSKYAPYTPVASTPTAAAAALQDLRLLNRPAPTTTTTAASHHPTSGPVGIPGPTISNKDLDKICSTITEKLLEYFQARDQAFLSLSEKRMRLEEERERKRVEREAEIELKRHHLIVKVCELITNKCSNGSGSPGLTSPPSPASSPAPPPHSPAAPPRTVAMTES